jgi:hypothetical protein
MEEVGRSETHHIPDDGRTFCPGTPVRVVRERGVFKDIVPDPNSGIEIEDCVPAPDMAPGRWLKVTVVRVRRR